MEAAERETRRFLKEERMYLLALRALKADEKAVGASLRFSKQRAGNLLRKWNAYCKKLKIIRRFAKKIVWRGLAKFMCSWKEYAKTMQERKVTGFYATTSRFERHSRKSPVSGTSGSAFCIVCHCRRISLVHGKDHPGTGKKDEGGAGEKGHGQHSAQTTAFGSCLSSIMERACKAMQGNPHAHCEIIQRKILALFECWAANVRWVRHVLPSSATKIEAHVRGYLARAHEDETTCSNKDLQGMQSIPRTVPSKSHETQAGEDPAENYKHARGENDGAEDASPSFTAQQCSPAATIEADGFCEP